MAINIPWQHTSDIDPFDVSFEFTDFAIGGKLIAASLNVSPMEQMRFANPDDYKRAIKEKMAREISRAMIEGNFIEFTRLPHIDTGGDIIHARCYLAPNEQVKILRLNHAKSIQR